jgi:hypothetical protein
MLVYIREAWLNIHDTHNKFIRSIDDVINHLSLINCAELGYGLLFFKRLGHN